MVVMPGGQWSLDESAIMPDNPDPEHVSFMTQSRHMLIDSRHRRPKDSSDNYRIFFGVREEENATFGEIIRNVVSVNVISAEIPRTADNIIADRNTLTVNVLGSDYAVTVTRGLYLSETAINTALMDALNTITDSSGNALVDASGNDVQFDVEQTTQNRLRVYCSHTFNIVVGATDQNNLELTLAFQLGFATASATAAPVMSNDDAGPVDSSTFPFMIESLRFTNLMPRPYVDISIPEIPRIGTKLTNNNASRVLARVPLGNVPGGSQHYEPTATQLIHSRFHPITLTHMTIQLTGSDGLPYDSRDTPHTLSIEVKYLADPIVKPPPKPVPQTPSDIVVVETEKERTQTWLERNRTSIILASTGAVLTFYVVGKLKRLVRVSPKPFGYSGPPMPRAAAAPSAFPNGYYR